MAKVRPDFSFVREDRPLSSWLIDLVGDDPEARIKAADVLHGMWFGTPYGSTKLDDLDWEEFGRHPGQSERFDQAVREAADAPEFPGPEFIRRLIVASMLEAHNWRRFWRKSRERAAEERDKVVADIVRRLAAAGSLVHHGNDDRRRALALCSGFVGRDDDATNRALSHVGFAVFKVVRALDTAFLADRIGLRAWLDLDVLRRIGPPAVEFAPPLLDRLDAAGDERYSFDAAAALGSIGRDDPAVVAALLGRLRSGTPAMRSRVAECLYHAGPALAGRVDEAVAALLELTRAGADPGYTLVEALGSVGRDREDVLARLLEWASPRPPRWVADEYGWGGRQDMTMYERGCGLAALRFFPRFADRIVPVLIEAMGSFEEYDPDWTYDGAHGRVCRTLATLGSAAVAATGALVAYLQGYLERSSAATEDGDDWPKAVFDALAGIGPAAAAALPVLEALRRRRAVEDGDEAPPPLDRTDELDRAILAIRGEIARPTLPPTSS